VVDERDGPGFRCVSHPGGRCQLGDRGHGGLQRDGKVDLLWRNRSTGQNSVWLMNGTALVSGASLPPVADANWEIVCTADFNGDGKVDLLWRNRSTGQNSVWLMNGTALVSGVSLRRWLTPTGDCVHGGLQR